MNLKHVATKGSLSVLLGAALAGGSMAAVPDGYIVRVESATVYLDWGTASGAQVGDRFDVYREGEVLKHPVTGDILGHAQKTLGTGRVETLDPKFSVGHLDQTLAAPRAGDRTHWRGESLTAPVAPATASPVSPETNLSSPVPAMSELWRSDPLEKNAMGIAFADLDGDGQKDIIVAYREKIQAYRWKDKKLEPLASFNDRHYRHWLAVDTADLKHEGREEVFATAYQDQLNRPRIVVLRYENGALKQVGEIEGFARSIPRLDGSRHLYWQTFSRSPQLSYTAVSELMWEKGKYRQGPPLDLKLFGDQLFGFAWGDWYKSGTENFAVLEHGDRIRVFSPDVKWKSSDVYGGTKADFSFNDNTISTLQPRLMNWRPARSDRDELITPLNSPELGIRLTYLKIYHKSELQGLTWNGLEMKPAWRIPIHGYLADYGIVDLMGQSKPQLWVAATGPGDKTILLSYSLP